MLSSDPSRVSMTAYSLIYSPSGLEGRDNEELADQLGKTDAQTDGESEGMKDVDKARGGRILRRTIICLKTEYSTQAPTQVSSYVVIIHDSGTHVIVTLLASIPSSSLQLISTREIMHLPTEIPWDGTLSSLSGFLNVINKLSLWKVFRNVSHSEA